MLAALAMLALLAGCERPEQQAETAPEVHRRKLGEGVAPVVAVRKIVDQNRKVLGYVKEMEDTSGRLVRGKPVDVYWVYDAWFNRLGFYTESGETWKLARDVVTGEMELRPLGDHDVDDSKRILLGMTDRIPIELAPMDPPRTLESDAEAERAARAKAAAEAAKAAAPAAEKPEGEKKE
jgi:hypothetical protein